MSEQKKLPIPSLQKQSFGLLIGLSLEYILGITTTLFIEFPERAAEGKLWAFAWKQIPIALHILLGLFLLIGSIVLFIRAIKAKQKPWIIASSIGLVAILATSISGATFVGTQSDAYSFAMALGFIIAVLAYAWGIYA